MGMGRFEWISSLVISYALAQHDISVKPYKLKIRFSWWPFQFCHCSMVPIEGNASPPSASIRKDDAEDRTRSAISSFVHRMNNDGVVCMIEHLNSFFSDPSDGNNKLSNCFGASRTLWPTVNNVAPFDSAIAISIINGSNVGGDVTKMTSPLDTPYLWLQKWENVYELLYRKVGVGLREKTIFTEHLKR